MLESRPGEPPAAAAMIIALNIRSTENARIAITPQGHRAVIPQCTIAVDDRSGDAMMALAEGRLERSRSPHTAF